MTNHSSLSSEQALDDYFSALLEDSLDNEISVDEPPQRELVTTKISTASVELPSSTIAQQNLQPMAQMAEASAPYSFPSEEVEVPNLEDVERLLEQLESSNPVVELELEQVMAKNTADIAKVQTETQEIQDWVVESPHIALEEQEAELAQAPIVTALAECKPDSQLLEEKQSDNQIATDIEQEAEAAAQVSDVDEWNTTQRDIEFQVLYFDVNQVTFAVPLDELGGLHQMTELNQLIGRPDWYLGLQTSREAQLDVVDTAKWVMAEKLEDEDYKERYQYIVMLGESMWGLASTQLMGTELLNPEKVRWRETAGKRPWLAGMVTEKMCALIHVEAMIAMLNAGLDVQALK